MKMFSRMRYGCLGRLGLPRLDVYLTHQMAKLGENIARNPVQFLGFSLLLIMLFSTGLQRLSYQSDPGYLFVPSNARAFQEQNVVRKWFPNKMNRFLRGAEVELPMATEIAILPLLEGADILDPDVWRESFHLANAIEKIQVTFEEDLYTYRTLCARFDGKCVGNDFLNLYDRIGEINLTYPIMKDPRDDKMYPMLAHIGGATLDGEILTSGRALKLSFIMDRSSRKKKSAGQILTQVIRMYATSINYKHIKVSSVTDMTIEEELSSVIDGSIQKMPLTLILVVGFAVYNCLSTDWVRSKPLIGVASVIVSGLSFSSASGLAMYLGIQWQAINIICLSLTLGIGLDDTFVLLSAWWRSEVQAGRDVVSRMSSTYSDAAVSITVTSVTNIASFLVGAAIPGFPAVRIFCFYSGLCMMFLYLWSLLIIGPCLTIAGHLEHANRHCLFFVKVDSKSEAEYGRNWLYSVFFQGGVSKKDSNNPRDNKEGKFMVFFRDVLAPFINKPLNKFFIIVFFLAYLGAAIYGVTQLEEGLERNKLVGHHSYAMKFYDAEDTFFRDNPYRFQIIIDEELAYWNETIRNSVFDLIHKLEDSPYIKSDPAYRQSWLHQFMEKAEENFLFFDISTQQNFLQNLIKFMEVLDDTPFPDDVIFSSDNSTILASRFFLQSSRVIDAREEVKLLHSLRMIVDSAPFKATIYHPYFSFFDQFAQVTRTTLECVTVCCVCMTLITMMFIPDRRSIVWVTFTILSVETGIIGFMAIFGIRLDVISMIVIIMGIGFSVDFSAHISYHYLTAGVNYSAETRVKHCLHALGPPIIRGGLSTMIGVLGLYFHPSYITETFATMIFLIITLGILHSLLLLPVLLSLFGPGSSQGPSDIKLASPSQLSETFTYQASETPQHMPKKKSQSLRKLILSSGLKNVDWKDIALDESESSLSSWYSSHQGPEFSNYIMQRFVSNKVPKTPCMPTTGEDSRLASDPLPYYKFAHVKRAMKPPQSRELSQLQDANACNETSKFSDDSMKEEQSD